LGGTRKKLQKGAVSMQESSSSSSSSSPPTSLEGGEADEGRPKESPLLRLPEEILDVIFAFFAQLWWNWQKECFEYLSGFKGESKRQLRNYFIVLNFNKSSFGYHIKELSPHLNESARVWIVEDFDESVGIIIHLIQWINQTRWLWMHFIVQLARVKPRSVFISPLNCELKTR